MKETFLFTIIFVSLFEGWHWDSNLYCAISDVRLLKKMDDEISDIISGMFIELSKKLDTRYKKRKESQFFSVHSLAGSMKEAKMFQFNPNFIDNVNKEVEVDIEGIVYEIPYGLKHCVENIPNHEGFAQLQIRNGSCHCKECFGTIKAKTGQKNKLETFSTSTGYMRSYSVKSRYHSLYWNPDINKDIINLVMAFISNIPLSSIWISSLFSNITKSTIAAGSKIHINGKYVAKLGLDFAAVIKLNLCPKVLEEWKHRRRNWPCLKDVENETSKSYLITKPSFREKNNKDSTELRYSFAHLERKLISLQSDNQRLIYFIFKSMFYRWLKPINPDIVTSFIGKNVMFWSCEEYPPWDAFWDDTTTSIFKALRYLFNRLLYAFKKRVLSYYFVPSINIIEHMPEDLLANLSSKTLSIAENVKSYLPCNTESVLIFVESFRKWTYKSKDFVEELFKEKLDLSFVFERRPEFLFHLRKHFKLVKSSLHRKNFLKA